MVIDRIFSGVSIFLFLGLLNNVQRSTWWYLNGVRIYFFHLASNSVPVHSDSFSCHVNPMSCHSGSMSCHLSLLFYSEYIRVTVFCITHERVQWVIDLTDDSASTNSFEILLG